MACTLPSLHECASCEGSCAPVLLASYWRGHVGRGWLESCFGSLLTLHCHLQIERPGVAHTPFVTPVVLGSAGTEQT